MCMREREKERKRYRETESRWKKNGTVTLGKHLPFSDTQFLNDNEIVDLHELRVLFDSRIMWYFEAVFRENVTRLYVGHLYVQSWSRGVPSNFFFP